MSERPLLYVVEDDPEIRDLLRTYLAKQGFRVDCADGAAAMDRLLATYGEPALLVLDVMLPGEDGLSICRRLRAGSRIPIIMLTAKGEDIDRIVGLEIGADDYLAKPFNPRELVARIKAILRRSEARPMTGQRFRLGALLIDIERRSLMRADQPVELTSAEFDLLVCFVTHPGRVLSRDQLMDWTRGRRAEALDRTIDVQLSRLRKKLEVGNDVLIKTVRNAGYQLAQPVVELKP